MTRPTPSETLTLHVPFRLARRGGRKRVLLPPSAPQPALTDSALVKALARAFRWKRMLDQGEVATIGELAPREKIAPSYLARMLNLTLLAPDVVEAILDGRQRPELALALALAKLMKGVPAKWERQCESAAMQL